MNKFLSRNVEINVDIHGYYIDLKVRLIAHWTSQLRPLGKI